MKNHPSDFPCCMWLYLDNQRRWTWEGRGSTGMCTPLPSVCLSGKLICPSFFSFYFFLEEIAPIFDFSFGNSINFEVHFREQFHFEPSGVPVDGFTTPSKFLSDFPLAKIINAIYGLCPSQIWHFLAALITGTARKMKFSIKDFFSKCYQIPRKLRIWSHLLKKSLMENFIFGAMWFKYIVY